MTKFTEIILNGVWTEKMVEDFNGSNQDLKDMKAEELKTANENILTILASLDDLKRSINEEIKEREKDKDKEIVEGYLNSFTTENNPIKKVTNRFAGRKENELVLEEIKKEMENQINEGVSRDITKGTFVKRQEAQISPRQEAMGKAMARAINEVRENIEKKEEHKTNVPEKITKAIEIAKKYNVGVSFIENGDIAKMIQNGQVSIEDAMIPIMDLYAYLVETKTASKEDADYIMEVMKKELHIEDVLKSLLAKAIISKLV